MSASFHAVEPRLWQRAPKLRAPFSRSLTLGTDNPSAHMLPCSVASSVPLPTTNTPNPVLCLSINNLLWKGWSALSDLGRGKAKDHHRGIGWLRPLLRREVCKGCLSQGNGSKSKQSVPPAQGDGGTAAPSVQHPAPQTFLAPFSSCSTPSLPSPKSTSPYPCFPNQMPT